MHHPLLNSIFEKLELRVLLLLRTVVSWKMRPRPPRTPDLVERAHVKLCLISVLFFDRYEFVLCFRWK